MINNISKWAGSIVIAVIIVTILEMILPEGKNKKYIKTIMGIYILFTVISPIVKSVSGKDIDIENLINVQNSIVTSTNTGMQTSSSIENLYITNLKNDIALKLKQKGYMLKDAELIIENANEENYGQIYNMILEIKKNDNSNQGEDKKNIPIIEISIGNTGLKKKLPDENTITENEKYELKKYLNSIYDVKVERIDIKEAIGDDSR